MPNGFFLGGVAEGMDAYDKRAIDRERLATTDRLQSRGLDIQDKTADSNISINDRAQTLAEKNAARSANQDVLTRADKTIADTMAVVGETVKQSTAAGRDPATIQKAVQPLVDSVKRIAAATGKDPSIYDAQVSAMVTNPTAIEAKAVEGAGNAASKVAEAKALDAAGYQDPNGGFKTKDEKVKAENALRDDYLKSAQSFTTIRDAKNRIDNLDKSGAGDMALVFNYMKILDPGSTVREGEYATAANSGGVPSAVQALYNKAIGEGSIGDKARAGILSQANKMYEAAGTQHDKTTTQFANIAKRQGMNVDNVIIDLKPGAKPIAGTTPSGLKFSVRP